MRDIKKGHFESLAVNKVPLVICGLFISSLTYSLSRKIYQYSVSGANAINISGLLNPKKLGNF